jgi:hypothetical protein
MDHVLNHLAMPQWRTIWKRLWRTMIYSPLNNTWQSSYEPSMREPKTSTTPNSQPHCTCNQSWKSWSGQNIPRCKPSNRWSVPGTKRWPRLTLQDSLGHNSRGCNYEGVYGMTTLHIYKSTSIIIQFFIKKLSIMLVMEIVR